MNIWCPVCGCDVSHLLSQGRRDERTRLTVEAQRVKRSVQLLRSLVKAMEAHALKKPNVQRRLPVIYRLWSRELLTEVERRFPTKSKSKLTHRTGR